MAGRRGVPVAVGTLSRHLPSVVLGLGIVGAVAAGHLAYRAVGPYGDGPFGAGYRRVLDVDSGRHILVYEFQTPSSPIRAVVNERTGRFEEFRYDSDGDGRTDQRLHVELEGRIRTEQDFDADGVVDRWLYYPSLAAFERDEVERIGFSTARDSVVDAWHVHGVTGPTGLVEVSTDRDGSVDRWEYYEDSLLTRVEEDTNGDGQVDAWWDYDEGLLIGSSSDNRANP